VFSGQNMERREAVAWKTAQHVEVLADSVYGWGLGHPGPSAVKPVRQAGASTRPPLFIPELAYTKVVGEQIKFGSVAGEVLSTNAQLVAAEDVERTSTSTAIALFPSVLPTVTSHESVACSEL